MEQDEMDAILAGEFNNEPEADAEDLARELVVVETNMIQVQAQISQATAVLQTQLKTWEEQSKHLRVAITNAMQASVENGGDTKYEDDFIALTYVKPSVRAGVDVAKMKLLEPELYEKYRKDTTVKSSVRIRVK